MGRKLAGKTRVMPGMVYPLREGWVKVQVRRARKQEERANSLAVRVEDGKN